MARENRSAANDEKTDDEPISYLNRRAYLKAAGVTAVAAATNIAGGSAAAAAAEDYDVITVPAGDTYSVEVTSGETFENKLIDISAAGATFDIEANGSNWTVRNIGIKGIWDQYEKAEPFRASVSAGSTALIENFYFADGCPDNTYAGVTGIYVYKFHAGTLRINQVNIQDLPDNAIYASTPGRPPSSVHAGANGSGGVVEITNSFAKDCQASHFRLGTDGSFAKNCVAVGGDGGHRGFLGRFNDTKAIDCDFVGHLQGDVACGTFQWDEGADATVTVENCRFKTSGGNLTYKGDIIGESVGEPRTEPPAGVPLTAEEAAGGTSTAADSSGSDTTTSDETGDADPSGTVLELVAGSDTSSVPYEFTVEGSVSKRTSSGDTAADPNDTITENGDGTVSVAGVSGNGYGDSYFVDGDLVSMNLDESKWTLRYGGEQVTVDELVLPNKLVIDGTSYPRLASDYTFKIRGTARKSAALGSINAQDTISDSEISGRVINGKDGYRYSGEIVGFSIDGPASVQVEEDS